MRTVILSVAKDPIATTKDRIVIPSEAGAAGEVQSRNPLEFRGQSYCHSEERSDEESARRSYSIVIPTEGRKPGAEGQCL